MASVRPGARRLGHQPALDGLRGVAVAAVVLYHGDVRWALGGFTGVDAFFVVSGYLITTLLVDELSATGRIDLRAFWVRRIRRLFPALVLLLLAVAAYVLVAAPDVLRRSIRLDGLATLAYLANWRLIWSDQGYFEVAAGLSPLRHTWSLAVEEQWYLVWPLVVVAGAAVVSRAALGGRRALGIAAVGCGALAVASAVWMSHLVPAVGDPSRAYYGTDTRAQALLVGAALAFALRWRTLPSGVGARRAVAAVGALGLVVGLAIVGLVGETDRVLYRGGFLVVALAWGAVVVASLDDAAGPVRWLLSLRPLVLLGLISYGVYLWNWPAVVVLTPARTGIDGWPLDVLQIGATLAAAIVSYVVVERPVRLGRLAELSWWRPAMAVPVVAAVTAIALLGSAAGAPQAAIGASGFAAPPQASERVVLDDLPEVAAPGALAPPSGAPSPPAPPTDRPLRVAVVGDSVGFSFVWFAPTLPDIELTSGAVVGCGVLPGELQIGDERRTPQDDCPSWSTFWSDAAATDPDVVLVALGAWEVYDTFVDGERLSVGTERWRSYLDQQLDEGLGVLLERPNVRVGILSVPCFDDERPMPGGAPNARNDPARVSAVNEALDAAVARHPGRVTRVAWGAFACPDGDPDAEVDGLALRPDGLHVDRSSAVELWRWLGPVTSEIASRPSL